MSETALARPDSLGLVQMAIERGTDPAQLEKLVELHERMEKRYAERAFNEAMNALQSEMPVVVRDRKNEQTNSLYAQLETINERIKPCYTKHGFSLSFGEEKSDREGLIRTVCDVRHIAGHSVRYHIDLPSDSAGIKGTVNKTPVHAAASSGTYAQRYLVCRIFNVTIANTDRDGNTDEGGITEEQVSQINGLLDKCRDAGKEVNFERLLKWHEVEHLGQLTPYKWKIVMHYLRGIAGVKEGKQ